MLEDLPRLPSFSYFSHLATNTQFRKLDTRVWSAAYKWMGCELRKVTTEKAIALWRADSRQWGSADSWEYLEQVAELSYLQIPPVIQDPEGRVVRHRQLCLFPQFCVPVYLHFYL